MRSYKYLKIFLTTLSVITLYFSNLKYKQVKNTGNNVDLQSFSESVNHSKKDYTVYPYNYTALSCGDVRKIKLNFLQQFKNPCWVEENTSENVYESNQLIHTKVQINQHSKTLYPTMLAGFKKYIGHGINPTGVSVTLKSGPCSKTSKCRLRCLPYFMLLGVAKSGTTDFTYRIHKHPNIVPGWTKEIFWWNQYRFSIPSTLRDYSDMFAKNTDRLVNHKHNNNTIGISEPIMGDFTSMTFFDFAHWRKDSGNKDKNQPHFTTPTDIKAVLPNLKMIVMFRNPTNRFYSSYNYLKSYNGSPRDFHNYVLGSIWWWNTCINKLPIRSCAYGSPPSMPPVYDLLGDRKMWYNKQRNYTGEIRNGMYALMLRDWLSVFPRENFLFLRFEDYSKDIANTFNQHVFPFLGVHKLNPISDKFKRLEEQGIVNENNFSHLPMLNETRMILNEFYKPFNEQLATMLKDVRFLWM